MTAGIEIDPAERDAIAAEVNISVLKRSDTAIKCVLKSANHVCLYQLGDDHQWRRLDVEGSLFIVERHLDHHSNPHRHSHRIVIINRKSLNNYIDDIIVGNKHLEIADQMIMYSNSKQQTIGIWFYQKAQADDIFAFLQRIVSAQNPHPSPDPSRPKRTPKRPARPAQSPENPAQQSQPPAEPVQPNPLERFFPNLKLTNGVAGHQVPESAKESMFESHAVSTMSASPTVPQPATEFKPTAEIDAAIITASENGFPEGAVPNSLATDVNTLASQAMQLVKGKPKSEQKRKLGARPRPSPKAASPRVLNQSLDLHSPSRANGIAKTASPPRSSPSAKPDFPTRSAVGGKSSSAVKQQKLTAKSSPPSKRAPGGRRGQAVKGSSSNKYQAVDRSVGMSSRTTATSSGRAEKSSATITPKPQLHVLTKPRPTPVAKPPGTSDQAAEASSGQVRAPSAPALSVAPTNALRGAEAPSASEARLEPPVSSADWARPSTPNVPIEKEIPGAPRAKQTKTHAGGGHAMHASASTVPGTNEGEKGGLAQQGRVIPVVDEEARRQLQKMQQIHAENLKMQEAHMLAMQPPFGFGSPEHGLGQTAGMMGGGLAGPGGALSGFAGSLHPQMAMMMQQQHQMFMQQQFMAQQRQRQMQLQAGHGHGMTEATVKGSGKEVIGSGREVRQAKTKEESANDLMRMLNVDRSDNKRMLHKIDDKKNVESVGGSIAQAEKDGELGTRGDKLDKVSFRAVVQRMLTDRRLFDSVYEHYLRSRG